MGSPGHFFYCNYTGRHFLVAQDVLPPAPSVEKWKQLEMGISDFVHLVITYTAVYGADPRLGSE